MLQTGHPPLALTPPFASAQAARSTRNAPGAPLTHSVATCARSPAGLAAATLLFITTGLLSVTQVSQVRDALHKQVSAGIAESSGALAR